MCLQFLATSHFSSVVGKWGSNASAELRNAAADPSPLAQDDSTGVKDACPRVAGTVVGYPEVIVLSMYLDGPLLPLREYVRAAFGNSRR